MIDINLWIAALTKPVKTFREQDKKGDWNKGFWNVLIAGVVAGIISGIQSLFTWLAALAFLGPYGALLGGAGILNVFGAFIGVPVLMVVGWAVISFVIDWVMTAMKKKGDMKNLAYLFSLFTAPLAIIGAVVGLVPIIGWVLSLLVGVYDLYLLILVLNQVYGMNILGLKKA